MLNQNQKVILRFPFKENIIGQAKQKGTFEQRKEVASEVAASRKIAQEYHTGRYDNAVRVVIADTLKRFIDSGHPMATIDFDLIRPKSEPILEVK